MYCRFPIINEIDVPKYIALHIYSHRAGWPHWHFYHSNAAAWRVAFLPFSLSTGSTYILHQLSHLFWRSRPKQTLLRSVVYFSIWSRLWRSTVKWHHPLHISCCRHVLIQAIDDKAMKAFVEASPKPESHCFSNRFSRFSLVFLTKIKEVQFVRIKFLVPCILYQRELLCHFFQ